MLKELKPIKESTEDYDKIELAMITLLREYLFLPIVEELGAPKNVIKNSIDDLLAAVSSGRIYFDRGKFYGKFNSTISRELKRLGAKWKKDHYEILASDLPVEISTAVRASQYNFEKKASKIDEVLSKILPEEIAEKLKVADFFDSTLWKVEKDFQDSVKNITVAPKLSPEAARRVSKEYEQNMQLEIKGWIEKEVVKLRKEVQESTAKGFRYEEMVSKIQRRYGVSQNKAKFLARQETSLLMTKFKQLRYQEAGVNEYIWGCVAGSKNHPVRPMHKALEGKTFRWDNPPVTDEKGNRNNPGQDYNCRCFARPVVKF